MPIDTDRNAGERQLHAIQLQKRFAVELALLNGIHRTENTHRSIIHFSVNKSATQYVKSILRRCAEGNGMVNVDINDFAYHSDFPFLDQLSADEMRRYQHIFKPSGYLYSVFGGMVEGIPSLERYLIVLMVRDPRDVLVSSYYSIAYSHGEPSRASSKYEEFMEKRGRASNMEINEFVRYECGNVLGTYNRYTRLLADSSPNVYVTKYEDMVSDFHGWLKALVAFCNFDIPTHYFQTLVEENQRLKPDKENVYKHLRKGRAGDYKEKLESETIAHIESKLAPALKAFRYK